MKSVFSIGEALIDFIPSVTELDLKDVPSFKRVMGGAPANVAMTVSKLGGTSSFISKLGRDAFGDHVVEQLEKYGVDTTYLLRTNEANTGLAFVSLKENGQRDFSFYRNPSADMLLSSEDVKGMPFKEGDILHFCSVDLIEAPVKYAHKQVIEDAIKGQAVISFDPNVRLPLWPDEATCQRTIQSFIPFADVLKVSDEELQFITGIEDESEALKSLFQGRVKVVIYTRGKNGSSLLTKDARTAHDGFKVKAIDTTGAGDAFIGSFLYQLAIKKETLEGLSVETFKDMLTFSNAFAALTTTKHGAVSSLPSMDDTNKFIENNEA